MHSSAKKHDYSTANIIGSYYSGVTVSEEKVNLEEVRGDRGGENRIQSGSAIFRWHRRRNSC